MTLQQIKQATIEGQTVHWGSNAYQVKQNKKGTWLIVCLNGYCFDLLDKNGNLECKLEDFFIYETSTDLQRTANAIA